MEKLRFMAGARRNGLLSSTDDFVGRMSVLNRKELTLLASVGALNSIDGVVHRRDAPWQPDRAGKLEGPLLGQSSTYLCEESNARPLLQMSTDERLMADYAGTGLTVGKHPAVL